MGVILVTASAAWAEAGAVEGEGSPCTSDDQCPRRTICDADRGRCTRIRRHINLLYMVYRSSDRRFTEVMGIYWHRKGRRGYRVVFPIYWSFWSPESLAIYEHHRSPDPRTRLFLPAPPYYHLRDRRRSIDVAPPLVARFRDHERDTTTWVGLGGAFVQHRTPTTSAQVLFPLWWRLKNLELGTHTTVLASGFYHRARDGWQLGVAPLFFAGRRGDSSHAGLLPAFWHHLSAGTTTTWVAPFNLYRRNRDRRHLVLAPLLFAGWSPERRHLVLPPLFWHFRSPGKTSWFVGPGYYHRTRGGGALFWHFGGEQRASTVAFPLLWHFRRPGRRSTVVFPVYWDFTRGDRRTTVVLNTLYRRDRRKRTYDFHFLPPVRVQRKRPRDLKLSFVAGLFGYERIGRNRMLKLFLVPIDITR